MEIFWRIYYADGSTFDNTMGAPHETPSTGFVCARGYDETGVRYIMHGWDHYRFDKASEQWWGCDLVGVLCAARLRTLNAYIEGQTVTKSQYNALMKRAHDDPDFAKDK